MIQLKEIFDIYDKNFNIDIFVKILRSINKATDDYLFLYEFKSDTIWYFGNINKRFPIQNKGIDHCNIKEAWDVSHPNDRNALKTDLEEIAAGIKDVHDMEYRWIDNDGKSVWISCRGTVLYDSDSKPFALLGRVSDTALKHKIDKKTNLFNKSKMVEHIEQVLQSGRAGHFIVLGIDDIKNINICYGRQQGDEVLKRVAEALETITDNPFSIFRLDGDCFGIDSKHTDAETIVKKFNLLRSMLKDVCTFSAGAVSYGDIDTKEPSVVYQCAENVMDKVKSNGKDGISFFKKSEHNGKFVDLTEELRTSIENGCEGFYLVYQPQISIDNNTVYGAEALLRYTSKKQGTVYPNDFIPVLEKTGMIRPVGLWVLEQAISDCKMWHKTNPYFHINVNLSYEQLKDTTIADKVLNILDKYNFPGESLTFEVTESIQLQDFPYYNKIFEKWKNCGIEIAVDDFGTGYSSLAYLKNLNIDEIKIDRCFVTDIQNSTYNYRLIKNIIELAESADIRVCCEGVENAEEVPILKELRAGLAQGFYYSKPIPKEDFEKSFVS